MNLCAEVIEQNRQEKGVNLKLAPFYCIRRINLAKCFSYIDISYI